MSIRGQILCLRRYLALGAWVLLAVMAASNAAGQDAAAKAPIKRVVLFNSGVGYFEHQGQVDGNASIELTFDVDDVNDLLKSMVLEDRGGGKISTVTYGSRDPITKTLQTFAIDLTSSPTLGQLLAQIRGERVELDAGAKIEGAIVGVETRRQTTREGEVIEQEYLNLLTDEGLQRVSLDAVRRIKLARQELDDEFRQALDILASGHAADKKAVTLEFLGEGEREVRVGYIQEAPVWKTSYRLVLDEKGKPFLQGWAIVENTTDADWDGVRLSLVSGRPISFVMDLYSPLYAQRPVEVPEMYASLRPQAYEQDLKSKGAEAEQRALSRTRGFGVEVPAVATAAMPASAPADGAAAMAGARFSMSGRSGGMGDGAAAPDYDALISDSFGKSVQAATQASDVGELFKYEIDGPVTLARQSSAMLPIINGAIEGDKVSIYNAGVHAKHPLNGVKIKNTSELHLMQGPVTVFDGGVYAGDAKLPDLSAGSERLLSYALDLDVEVAPASDAQPQHLVSAKIDKGVMTASYKQTRTQTYTMKNSGAAARTVLVEHAIENGWVLVTPKEPSEKTRDMYRFSVTAEPGKPAELSIEEEQTIHQQVALQDPAMGIVVEAPAVQVFLSSNKLSESVKAGLREVIKRHAELAKLHRRKQQLEQEIAVIGEEQNRIRPNMQTIDRNTDLYNRYVKKFTEQEDRIETLREEIRTLETQINESQAALTAYLSELTLE